jgi:8-oxo-dGTP diphosphatase
LASTIDYERSTIDWKIFGLRLTTCYLIAMLQVTAGVIARDQTVLVCQRPPGGYHPGRWEFPGGKVDPGESLAIGMRRELAEELGIVVGRVLWQTMHRYPERDPLRLTFFAIPRYTGTVTNRCFAALRWVPIGALADLDLLEADREFVTALSRREVRLD